MFVRLLHPEKVDSPMPVTLSGIFIVVRLLQPEKVDVAMLLTLSGILIEISSLQPEYLQLVVYQVILIKTVEK